MKINKNFPPNYSDILKQFPDLKNYKPIFTYGNTIYNPWDIFIDPALLVHEKTHSVRQWTDPAMWWFQYLVDPAFRLNEELLAYRAQWQYACAHYSHNDQRSLLNHITTALSSSLYGNLITKKQAKEKITNES